MPRTSSGRTALTQLWGRSADRLGHRWVLAISAGVGLLAPLIALALSFAERGLGSGFLVAAFGAIVFSLGVAASGVELASKNFILELAPSEATSGLYWSE